MFANSKRSCWQSRFFSATSSSPIRTWEDQAQSGQSSRNGCVTAPVTHSVDLMNELQTLFYLLEAKRLLIELEYIPSQDNIILDRLSCLSNKEDYHFGQIDFSAHPGQFQN